MKIDKKKIYKQLMWDYNLPAENIEDLMLGKIERLGHYDREMMFRKMLESLPWFVLLDIIGIDTIRKLLTDNVINKLRTPAMRNNYNYVKKRLQKIISTAR